MAVGLVKGQPVPLSDDDYRDIQGLVRLVTNISRRRAFMC
jgi:hypothetical protein